MWSVAVINIILIGFFLFFAFYFVPIFTWRKGLKAGVLIPILSLTAMRLRKTPPSLIMKMMIKAHQAGVVLEHERLEAHYLAGGDIQKLVNALIIAKRENLDLPFSLAAGIDLVGRELLETKENKIIVKPLN